MLLTNDVIRIHLYCGIRLNIPTISSKITNISLHKSSLINSNQTLAIEYSEQKRMT